MQAAIGSTELTPLKTTSWGAIARARLTTTYSAPRHSDTFERSNLRRSGQMSRERLVPQLEIGLDRFVVDLVIRMERPRPRSARNDRDRFHPESGDERQLRLLGEMLGCDQPLGGDHDALRVARQWMG